MALRVEIIPMLSDNYSYLLVDTASLKAACIDPVEPEKMLEVRGGAPPPSLASPAPLPPGHLRICTAA